MRCSLSRRTLLKSITLCSGDWGLERDRERGRAALTFVCGSSAERRRLQIDSLADPQLAGRRELCYASCMQLAHAICARSAALSFAFCFLVFPSAELSRSLSLLSFLLALFLLLPLMSTSEPVREKQCSQCKSFLPISTYSTTQLKKQGRRLCKSCIPKKAFEEALRAEASKPIPALEFRQASSSSASAFDAGSALILLPAQYVTRRRVTRC
jgi:hypothetical protein